MSKRKVITEEDVREVEKDLGKVIEKLELKKSQIRLVYRMFNPKLNPQLMQIQICQTKSTTMSSIFGDKYRKEIPLVLLRFGDFNLKDDKNGVRPIEVHKIHDHECFEQILNAVTKYLEKNIINSFLIRESTVKGEFGNPK